jgi:prepilin-type N-terminal cleavage/methylation domain-containing protein
LTPRHAKSAGVDHGSDDGFTLVEILVAIVLVGILAAVAVVGIGALVRKAADATCTASADAARAASAVYFATHSTYPVSFVELTVPTGSGTNTVGAPLALPAGVTASGLLATSASGGWTLSMTAGTATSAPTFDCGSTQGAPVSSAATPPCAGSFTGWRGEYFANISLAGAPTLCRDDAGIDFNWSTNAPMAALPADRFSVRWTRTQAFAAGPYTFTLGTDDGGRLYIDGALVLDRWVYQSYPTPQPAVTTTLAAGAHTIVVEYFEGNGYSRATLVISGPG